MSWQAAWVSILEQASGLALNQDKVFNAITQNEWAKESTLLHMQLNGLNAHILNYKIATEDPTINTDNMSKPKLIASLLELAIDNIKAKESERAQG